jgi:hypothetical protein
MRSMLPIAMLLVSQLTWGDTLGRFTAHGRGNWEQDAKWEAIKKAIMQCSGSARAVSPWSIRQSHPYPGCPANPTIPDHCVRWFDAEAQFECLE